MSLAERPVVKSSGADQELLRRHAPILHLDGRELFRPCAVDGYIEACVLADRTGVVDPEPDVARLDDRWGHRTHLRFIAEDDRRGLIRRETRRIARRVLSSRLGRVGLFGRLLDAAFLLSVWIRPCTPRLTGPAAAAKAERLALQTDPVCYGRTVRSGEWLVLHYAWFYVMNDWRTSYRGFNDHEADWEQAWIFCDPRDGRPIWIATSNHDRHGPDLRRHWEDPEVEKRGSRPVLFVAAGSHALFFRAGDYVTHLDVPSLRWLLRAKAYVGRILNRQRTGEQRTNEQRTNRVRSNEVRSNEVRSDPTLGVPFIDSAGGDGELVLDADLRDLASPAWANDYRGLWGLDTGDPLQGERGPSGPKFDRRGEVRTSWADPLGFAGLHGSLPPSAMTRRVNLDKIDSALEELDTQIRQTGRLLPLLHHTPSADELEIESAKMSELLRQQTELTDLRKQIESGWINDRGRRDHLRRPPTPLPGSRTTRWVMATWAAATVPLLLAGVGLALASDSLGLGPVVIATVTLVFLLEQLANGRVRRAVSVLALEVGAIAFVFFAVAEIVSFGPAVVGGALLSAAAILLLTNVAELRAIRRGRPVRVAPASERR